MTTDHPSTSPSTSPSTPPVTGHLAPLVREVTVRTDVDRAFHLFTEEIGDWWPLATHGVYGAGARVAFEDGRLVERDGDRSTSWGEVLDWEPPLRLRITWHPGLDPEESTEVVVTFTTEGERVRVRLTHSGWERRGDEGARSGYESGWLSVLGCFVEAA